MSTIFISYRREDTVGHAGRIYDRLVDRYGPEAVYRDVDSGQPGEDFAETIRKKVEGCDVLLALIGPAWLKATDDTGGWRLAQDDDFVRIEISTALERGIRVIPVLLQGAKMPRAGDLPSALSKLSHRNAVEIRDTHFDQDVSQLLAGLSPPWFRAQWIRPAIGIGLALLVAGGIGAVYFSQVLLTPDKARAQLTSMDIPYTADAFVDAAERKDATALTLFLKAGMDADAENRRGVTALQFAAGGGDLSMMKSLLKAGAKIDGALRTAAASGQLEALNLLLSEEPPRAALGRALAAAGGQPAAARLLLDRGADPNASDQDGLTPLMRAARKANPEVTKLLLARGANANAALADRFAPGMTPLYYSAAGATNEDAAIEVVTLLLEGGAEVNARAVDVNSSEGWTPLLAAVRQKHWKIARLLIERGADVNAQAVARDDADEDLGIGLTPLMLCAKEREIDTSLALLDRGANVGIRSRSGRTALSVAAEAGSAALVEVLLAHGAKVLDADKKGWPPLMYAATADVAAALLRSGADVDGRTTGGSTALFIAVEGRSSDIVNLLLSKGADPNAVNVKGWTPLMAAAFMGRAANVRALIEAGAREDTKNKEGKTALDIARKEESQDVVEILLADRRTVNSRPQRK
jgi:ankyrin repeat protein